VVVQSNADLCLTNNKLTAARILTMAIKWWTVNAVRVNLVIHDLWQLYVNCVQVLLNLHRLKININCFFNFPMSTTKMTLLYMHVHILHVNRLSLVWLHLTITYSIISHRNILFKLVPTLSGTQNYSTKQGLCTYDKFSKNNWDNFISSSDKLV
jgi:hypothetical protein